MPNKFYSSYEDTDITLIALENVSLQIFPYYIINTIGTLW